jgi:type IV secretion system protein VirB8
MTDVAKFAPWRAQPLSDAAKNAKFRQVMDLGAERVILGRSAIIAGWTVGGAGIVLAVAAAVAVAALVPLKTTEVKFLLVDKSNGIIEAPVGLEDAPKLFGDAVARQYLKRYVEAREEWVPQMDERNDHLTKLMSTPDEQTRHAAWRNSPMSPIKAVGHDGHVSIENFRFHAQATAKDSDTHRYLVQFDRTVWRGGTKDTPLPQAWSATVDFQWHPEFPMRPADRDDNPGGFLALSYSASPDTPDERKQ